MLLASITLFGTVALIWLSLCFRVEARKPRPFYPAPTLIQSFTLYQPE